MNQRFYEDFAEAFASKRRGPWAGWARLPVPSPADASLPVRVLDVGCGHGRFARDWMDRGRPALDYTGVDFSEALLRLARGVASRPQDRLRFVRATVPDAALPAGPHHLVVAFGLLHHVAGADRRRRLIADLAGATAPGGHVVLTVWQFGLSPRFTGRGQPPPPAVAEDEPASVVFDFDGAGERLCVSIALDEVEGWISTLAPSLGLRLTDRFEADGQTGALNLYLVFRREPAGEAPGSTAGKAMPSASS